MGKNIERMRKLSEFNDLIDRYGELKAALYDAKVATKYSVEEGIDYDAEIDILRRKCERLEAKLRPYEDEIFSGLEDILDELFASVIKGR